MPKSKDAYPVNEGVSGYWDVLNEENLARFDTAMDFVQVYISASQGSARISKPITDRFASEALIYLNAYMPQALGQRSGSVYPWSPEEKARGITLVS